MTVTMDKAGRIVIPLKIREKLHLKPGAEFDIEETGRGVRLEPKLEERKVIYKHGIPVFTGPADFDVVQEIEAARNERADMILTAGLTRKDRA